MPLARVDHDPVRHAVAADRLPDHLWVALVRELRRVDADRDEGLALKLPLDRRQHGQRVQAIDSAVRPEVEEHDPPAQVLAREQARDVEPGRLEGEGGGAHV